MTDSPTPGRHRSRKAPRRRGLIGPIVSAMSVLLAIAPVAWVMTSRDGSSVAEDPTKVLNVSEDNNGPAAVEGPAGDGSTPKPVITVTATLPNGLTTTLIPAATPAIGSAEPITTTPASGGPTTGISSGPGGLTTVTVTPRAPRTAAGSTTTKAKPNPQPTKTATTKTVTTEPTRDTPSEPPAGGGGTNAQEREVLDLVNRARSNQGCRKLSLDDSLVEAAGSHASDMVRRHYMDHTNPDGKDPGDRIEKAGFNGSGWGENIAAGYSSAQKVFTAWMNSEGHRNNILNCKFTKIGIGYDPGQVKSDWGPGSWVQDFGRTS